MTLHYFDINYIFSTIEDIKQASSMMLADLDSLTKKWNYYSCVGSVMLSHVRICLFILFSGNIFNKKLIGGTTTFPYAICG